MLNGRHLVLVAGVAAAGLLSVREAQRQITLSYKIAGVEKDIRSLKSKIQLCKIEHLALQSPKAVTTHAAELRLAVAPTQNPTIPAVATPNTSPRSTSNRRSPPPAPTIPALPGAPY